MNPQEPRDGEPVSTEQLTGALRTASAALRTAGSAFELVKRARDILSSPEANADALAGGRPSVGQARTAAQALERAGSLLSEAIELVSTVEI